MRGFGYGKRNERGANLVEMAILLPLLLLFLVGIADFGRAYHTYITMINAAREGARLAVEHPDDITAIQNVVHREAEGSDVDLSGANISVVSGGAGNPARVTIELDFPTFIGGFIGAPNIHIKTSSTFRVRG